MPQNSAIIQDSVKNKIPVGRPAYRVKMDLTCAKLKKRYHSFSSHVTKRFCMLLGLFFILTSPLHAQEKESFKSTITELVKSSVKKNPVLLQDPDVKSDAPFIPFAGKIIRSINIHVLNFGENVTDTVVVRKDFFERIGNKIHQGTEENIINNMLFIRIGQTIDPFVIADNERYIRNFNFIKDARIYIFTPDHSDSADVFIVTSDVFSIGANINASNYNDFKVSIFDVNTFGRGIELKYTSLFQSGRSPKIGSEIFFKKSSVFGSLADLELAYTSINSGISLGDEKEDAFYFRVNRPLHSNFMHYAGGFELSFNKSANRFNAADSIYLNYDYHIIDAWVGYNLITKPEEKDKVEDIQIRKFVALRTFNQYFLQHAYTDSFTLMYSNKRFILSEFNWFKLNYYRTQYVLGFGTTEDVQYGFNTKLSLGLLQIETKNSLYLGFESQHVKTNLKGDFVYYTYSLNTNIYQNSLKDVVLRLFLGSFSRIKSYRSLKYRVFLSASYVNVINQLLNTNLKIGSRFGVVDYSNYNRPGSQRLSATASTSVFTKLVVIGFNVGLFGFADLSYITSDKNVGAIREPYSSFGTGIRIRNENLVFGTIQFKCTYYARPQPGDNPFSIGLSTNLQINYSKSYANAPTIPAFQQ